MAGTMTLFEAQGRDVLLPCLEKLRFTPRFCQNRRTSLVRRHFLVLDPMVHDYGDEEAYNANSDTQYGLSVIVKEVLRLRRSKSLQEEG